MPCKAGQSEWVEAVHALVTISLYMTEQLPFLPVQDPSPLLPLIFTWVPRLQTRSFFPPLHCAKVGHTKQWDTFDQCECSINQMIDWGWHVTQTGLIMQHYQFQDLAGMMKG